ncbi:hypothetical protein C8F04DRAFT_1182387 [Mycena alexandri]|uniref:Uncharacterized protein n=1 Tax=Mycena alexandri TaxID=1745969 RepID=A0AAD6SZ25_9AGAR|nr:hypothetical protein C8F04DRAFT_1182387 [Mycena alexandri]
MTNQNNYSAPAAAPHGLPHLSAAAGAGVAPPPNVNGTLSALSDAVDALTAAGTVLVGTPMTQMSHALAKLVDAAEAVHKAHANVTAAFAALPAPAPVAPQVVPAAAAPVPFVLRHTAPWIAGNLYTVLPAGALTAVLDNGGKWFSITRGRYVGLTQDPSASSNAVMGVSNAATIKLANQTAALNHFNAALAARSVAVLG